MPTYVKLQRLYCERTEDWTGNDEAYLRFNGSRIWGPVSIDDNQVKTIDLLIGMQGEAVVELFDEDLGTWPDQDDNLGRHTIKENEAGTGDRSAKFSKDGASYLLFYKVARLDI